MKGLVLKDLYTLIDLYRRNLLLVCVIYGLIGIFANMPFFFYMMIWMMGFYSLSSLTVDQSCNWDRYARTLPVTAGQVVGAKFLVTAIFILFGMLYSLIVGSLGAIKTGENVAEFLCATLIVTGVAFFTMGFMLPAAYKMGVDKARNTMVIFYAALFGIFFFMFQDGGPGEKLLPGVRESVAPCLEQFSVQWLAAASIIIGVAVFFAGSVVSRRLYEAKEF